jgi:streptogrisin C
MRERRRIVAATAVAAALALSVATVALGPDSLAGTMQDNNSAQPAVPIVQSGQLDANGRPVGPNAAPASIAYLRQRYGISEAEAVRRIELQQASTELATSLAVQFPDEYAGMWLDQASGGVLTVGMTTPDKLAPAMAGVADAAHVRAVRMNRSLRQLTQSAHQIAAELGAAEGSDVVVDPPSNSVLVLTGNTVSASDTRLTSVRSRAEARVESRTERPYQSKACDPLRCSQPPMRGGIRLDVPRDDATVGGCTTGFNLRSATTGNYYVLTAGHCVVGGRHTRVDDTFHDFLGAKTPVTIEDANAGLAENDPANGHDYAIMPYQPGAQLFWWNGGPRRVPALPSTVNFWCPGGCAGSHDVRVTGYVPFAAIQVGWVVCATGAAYTPAAGENFVDSGAGAGYVPGTRCGEITSKDNRINAHICARPGDSGGPLFTEADGKALGILSGGDPGQGACTNPQEQNNYAPVSTILDRANSRTANTLRLELLTTPPRVLPSPPRGTIRP